MYKIILLFLVVLWSQILTTHQLPIKREKEDIFIEEDIDDSNDLELPEDKRSLPEIGKTLVGVPLRRSSISHPYPIPSEPKTERALKREDLAVGAPDTEADDDSPAEAEASDTAESGSGVASGSGLNDVGVKESEYAMQMRPMNRPNAPNQKGPIVEVEDPSLFQDQTIQEMNKSMNEPMMMYHPGNESGSGEN